MLLKRPHRAVPHRLSAVPSSVQPPRVKRPVVRLTPAGKFCIVRLLVVVVALRAPSNRIGGDFIRIPRRLRRGWPCVMTTILSCAADVAAPQANLRLNPFAANNTHAYCLRSERLSREWRAREQIALCSGDSISVATAVAAGVRYNSLGVSFASHRQPPSSVVELLLSGTRASQRTTGQIILDADAAPRRRHKDAASSLALGLKPEVKQLINHGYVTFNHTWGLRKAFGSALKEGVRLALSNHSRTEVFGGVSKYQALHGLGAPQVPGLDALEKRAVPRMLALATAYLGNDTVYSGYTVLRMASHDIPVKDYISGLWHHDRCGRRIKCFVFLTNTTARAHPLRIALGSHRTIFYSYDSFEVCASH